MYFDLHFHPSLKSFLSDEDPARRDSCWTTYRNFIDFAFGNIIDSQASLTQIDRSHTRLGVAAIYAMEDGLDDIGLIRNVAPIVSHLDKDVVRDIRAQNYWAKFLEEVRHLEGCLSARRGARPFRLISAMDEASTAHNNLVLAVEGGHVLEGVTVDPLDRVDELKNFRHRILYLTLCHFAQNPFCTQAYAMKLVKPTKVPAFLPRGTGLTDLGKAVIRRCYSTTTGRRVFIDVKHMSLSGRRDFYAWKAADPELAPLPILASHVGVTGISWDFDERESYWEDVHYLPSLGQWAVEYEKPRGIRLKRLKSHFNPSTINLFDEDIRHIVDSGGLIGLMMDQRQLGVNKRPFEYFSGPDFDALNEEPEEYSPSHYELDPVEPLAADAEFMNKMYRKENFDLLSLPDLGIDDALTSIKDVVARVPKRDNRATAATPTVTTRPAAPTEYDVTGAVAPGLVNDPVANHRAPRLGRKKRRHLLHLCNNLLHVIRVGGPVAWNHVCLGSDFDGLVDAPNNCESVLEYPDLEVHLRDMLHDLADAYGEHFRAEHDLTHIEEKVRGVMYGNAARWLEMHFTD